mmetsp:Transcript_29888/g.88466  ORF Transcript_29888/g.88466 Transcript_29888/m.88466 type:complete len:240 (+) Transcript_29888:481-1200(+)
MRPHKQEQLCALHMHVPSNTLYTVVLGNVVQAGFEHVYVCPLMVGTDLVPTFKALYLCSCDHDLWRRLEGAEGVHETWYVSRPSCRHAAAVRQLHEAGHLPYASLSAEDVLTCIDDADFHSSAPGAYLLCAPVRRIYARLPGVNVRKHKDIVIPYFSCRGGAGNPCKPVNRRAIVTVNMTSKRYTCSGCVYSQEKGICAHLKDLASWLETEEGMDLADSAGLGTYHMPNVSSAGNPSYG